MPNNGGRRLKGVGGGGNCNKKRGGLKWERGNDNVEPFKLRFLCLHRGKKNESSLPFPLRKEEKLARR